MTRYFDDSEYSLPIIHKCCGSHSGRHRKNCENHPLKVLHPCCGSKGFRHRALCQQANESEKMAGQKMDYTCPVCSCPQKINFNEEKIIKLKETEYFLKTRIDDAARRIKVLETVIRKKEETVNRLDSLYLIVEKENRDIKRIAKKIELNIK